jgi:hypothetical protein
MKIMRRIISFYLLIVCTGFMLVFSCEKDKLAENTCNVKNPLKDLGWLKNNVDFVGQLSPEESQYITISMATYKGETVFFSVYCDPTIEDVFPVRNCSGETIGYLAEIGEDELKDKQEIWRSYNCICSK